MKNVNLDKTGIGVDIEDIERFKPLRLNENEGFLRKIYTKKELEYCFSKRNPAQHLAVRYSGKESVIKALSSLGLGNTQLHDIEIFNEENGVPKVIIHSEKIERIEVIISLSHCEDKAVSFALVTILD
nr:holo-ACP synthase [uncultured Methanolobus sp.]